MDLWDDPNDDESVKTIKTYVKNAVQLIGKARDEETAKPLDLANQFLKRASVGISERMATRPLEVAKTRSLNRMVWIALEESHNLRDWIKEFGSSIPPAEGLSMAAVINRSLKIPLTKASKFPLPALSTSEVQAFKLFVQKAKPLRRAMAALKDAMTALDAGDARVAVYLSIRAAVLAGRGSAAVPKLAARIAEAAAEMIKKAMAKMAPATTITAAMGNSVLAPPMAPWQEGEDEPFWIPQPEMRSWRDTPIAHRYRHASWRKLIEDRRAATAAEALRRIHPENRSPAVAGFGSVPIDALGGMAPWQQEPLVGLGEFGHVRDITIGRQSAQSLREARRIMGEVEEEAIPEHQLKMISDAEYHARKALVGAQSLNHPVLTKLAMETLNELADYRRDVNSELRTEGSIKRAIQRELYRNLPDVP